MLSLDSTSPGDIVYSEREESEFIVSEIVLGTTTGLVSLYLMNLWDKKLKIVDSKYREIEDHFLVRANKLEVPPEHVYNTIQSRMAILAGEEGELKHLFNSKEGKVVRSFLFALTEVDTDGSSVGEGVKEIIHKIYSVSGVVPTTQEIYDVLRNNISRSLITDDYLRVLSSNISKESYKFKASNKNYIGDLDKTLDFRITTLKKAFFSNKSTPESPVFGGFLKVARKPNNFQEKELDLFVSSIITNPKKAGEILGINFGDKFESMKPNDRLRAISQRVLERFGVMGDLTAQERDNLTTHFLGNSKVSYAQLKYMFTAYDPTGALGSSSKVYEQLSRAKNELGWMIAGRVVGSTKTGSVSRYSLGRVSELERFSIDSPEAILGVDTNLVLAFAHTNYNRNNDLRSLFAGQERIFLKASQLEDLKTLDLEGSEIKALISKSKEVADSNPKIIVDPSDPRATVVKNEATGTFTPTKIEYPQVRGNIYPTNKGLFLADEKFNSVETQRKNFKKGGSLNLSFDANSSTFTLSSGTKKVLVTGQSSSISSQLEEITKAVSNNSYPLSMSTETANVLDHLLPEESVGLRRILSERSFIKENPLGLIRGENISNTEFFLNDSIIGGTFAGRGFKINGIQDMGGHHRILMSPSDGGHGFHLDLTPAGTQSFLKSLETSTSRPMDDIVSERALRIVNNINPFNLDTTALPIFKANLDGEINKVDTVFSSFSGYNDATRGLLYMPSVIEKVKDNIELSNEEALRLFPGDSHAEEMARNMLVDSWRDPSKKATYDLANEVLSSKSMNYLKYKSSDSSSYGLAYAFMMEQAYANPDRRYYHQPGLGVTVDLNPSLEEAGLPKALGKTKKRVSINMESGVSAETSLETLFASIVSSTGSRVEGDFDRVASSKFLEKYGFSDIAGLRTELRYTSTTDYTSQRAESLIKARGVVDQSPDLVRAREQAFADKGEGSLFNSFIGGLLEKKDSSPRTASETDFYERLLDSLNNAEGGLNDLPTILHSLSGHSSYSSLLRSKEGNDTLSILSNLDSKTDLAGIEKEIHSIKGLHTKEEIEEALIYARDNRGRNSPDKLGQLVRDRLEEIRSLREAGIPPQASEAKRLLDLTAKTQDYKIASRETNAEDIAHDINNLIESVGAQGGKKSNMAKAAALAAVVTLSQSITPSVMIPYTPRNGEENVHGDNVPQVRHTSVHFKISGTLSRENLNGLKNSIYDTISNSYVISNYINQLTVEQENALEQRQNLYN